MFNSIICVKQVSCPCRVTSIEVLWATVNAFTVCKYDFICNALYTFFVLVHNTSENTILFFVRRLFICRGLLFWTMWFFSLKKREKRKKKRSLFLPTVTAELTRGSSAGRRTIDSGSEGTSGSLLRPDGRPSRRVWPIGEEVKGRLLAEPPPLNLWLTVAYFDPLSDE